MILWLAYLRPPPLIVGVHLLDDGRPVHRGHHNRVFVVVLEHLFDVEKNGTVVNLETSMKSVEIHEQCLLYIHTLTV